MQLADRRAIHVVWNFSRNNCTSMIKSRENFCLLNVLKSSHSRTCLPENVCKFLFHCYAYAYVTLVSMVVGLRCAVRVHWHLETEEWKMDVNDGEKTFLLGNQHLHLAQDDKDSIASQHKSESEYDCEKYPVFSMSSAWKTYFQRCDKMLCSMYSNSKTVPRSVWEISFHSDNLSFR
ncbi:hypothetical protein T11_14644 [Trichinella zimbabwensis]|uniref:Uncharacterized protein n=1 Tax=Trichinella zimbabwensis TaxID=268475 RepID=A0A0V1HNU0_9BILA|nr:hypothetical protein T11_14644 [Trichinella zimbabwensis]